jgi:hypothetical protein
VKNYPATASLKGEFMTNEDEKIVADYMNWPEDEILIGYCTAPDKMAHFDLNDAGLVVAEMQKRGEWEHDFMDYVACSQKWNYHQCIAWLFNRENFFGAMAAWLMEGKNRY